jgi:hypothetical protein
MKILKFSLAACIALAYGPPGSNAAIINDFNDINEQQQAGEFILESGSNTHSGVDFREAYLLSNTSGVPDLTIHYFADVGGLPGATPLYQISEDNIGRTDTGVDIGDSDIFEYWADIPATIHTHSVTYWLSIANDALSSNGPEDWAWVTSGTRNMMLGTMK